MLITVYGYDYCPYTIKAAALAKVPVIPAADITNCTDSTSSLWPLLQEVKKKNHTTIPMCFDMHKRTNKFIGGYDKLAKYIAQKEKAAKRSRKPNKETKTKKIRQL